MGKDKLESLKEEIKSDASSLETRINNAKSDVDSAYEIPWSAGRAYVETSRDGAQHRLSEAKRNAINYGKGISSKYSFLDNSQRKELVGYYIELMKQYIDNN